MGKFSKDEKISILDSTLTKINDGTVIDCAELPWGVTYSVRLSNGTVRSFSESSLSRPDDVHIPPEHHTDRQPPVFQLRDVVTHRDSAFGRNRDMRIISIIVNRDKSYSYECLRKENPCRKVYREKDLLPARGTGI
jgi:hypothetical protein